MRNQFTGIWRVTLDPVEAGGPYNVTAATQSSTAALLDVLFGDVWLCGGQSNMYFKTSQVAACLSGENTCSYKLTSLLKVNPFSYSSTDFQRIAGVGPRCKISSCEDFHGSFEPQ